MCQLRIRLITFILGLTFSSAAFAQGEHYPSLGSPLKTLVKLIGFVNTPIAASNLRPVLTLKLPGVEKQYTFLLIDMKIMAGPSRTPEAILDDVKRRTPNFFIRGSRDIATQIAESGPDDRLSILAEYTRADRSLAVQSIEKEQAESQ
jgi:hypothetical protein